MDPGTFTALRNSHSYHITAYKEIVKSSPHKISPERPNNAMSSQRREEQIPQQEIQDFGEETGGPEKDQQLLKEEDKKENEILEEKKEVEEVKEQAKQEEMSSSEKARADRVNEILKLIANMPAADTNLLPKDMKRSEVEKVDNMEKSPLTAEPRVELEEPLLIPQKPVDLLSNENPIIPAEPASDNKLIADESEFKSDDIPDEESAAQEQKTNPMVSDPNPAPQNEVPIEKPAGQLPILPKKLSEVPESLPDSSEKFSEVNEREPESEMVQPVPVGSQMEQKEGEEKGISPNPATANQEQQISQPFEDVSEGAEFHESEEQGELPVADEGVGEEEDDPYTDDIVPEDDRDAPRINPVHK